jgi:WD40 repeat protein
LEIFCTWPGVNKGADVKHGCLSVLMLTLVFFCTVLCSSAQSPLLSGIVPNTHRGAVTGLLYDGDYVISAGEDGFVELWNPHTGAAERRFQISSAPVISITLRPGKKQIACLESDGIGFFRVSSWAYSSLQKNFVLEFRDPISYINYSAGGSFLIVAGNGRNGAILVDAETGALLPSPPDLTGPITFAATGRSERNMVVYSPEGSVSYWDLEQRRETNRFPGPVNMSSPILFGNRRFFAGIDSRGLVVVEAVSGRELARDTSVSRGTLAPDDKLDTGFLCLVPGGIVSFRILYPEGKLQRTGFLSFPRGSQDIRALAPAGDFTALGSAGGTVLLQESGGVLRPMEAKKQEPITEIAVGRNLIAFFTGDRLGYIPLNFSRLGDGSVLKLENAGAYTRLSPVPQDEGDRFILWNDTGARLSTGLVFDRLPRRSSIRSISALGDRGLFLDSAGNISVLSLDTGDPVFSFSSIGSMDAAFLNEQEIVLGRSVLSGNSPFLMIDTFTGETLPLSYPATAGALLYRGGSGAVYAATVDEKEGERRTSIIRLDLSDSLRSPQLVEYRGEDTVFSIAEAGGILASTLGDGEAAAYTLRGMVPFERGEGIPRSLAGGDPCFIVLDRDGNISWHDPESGKMLAFFRLYQTEWILWNPQSGLVRGVVSTRNGFETSGAGAGAEKAPSG